MIFGNLILLLPYRYCPGSRYFDEAII